MSGVPKYVQTHTVIDPDTQLPVEIEIRKDEGGGMIGVDGSFLENTMDDVHSPFTGEKYDWPDDDCPDTQTVTAQKPHYVCINYGDGVHAGVYCYPNERLAMQHVTELLAERLGNIHADDDDGVAFSYKIATALKAGDVDTALARYGEVPDNLESIEYNPINFSTATPLGGDANQLNSLLEDYLEA